MSPEKLGPALREDDEPSLRRRRWIVGLALGNIAAMGAVALFQVGVLKHVPRIPLPGEDADKIHGSAQAYSILNTPDGVLAVGSYALTAALAAMGPPDRARTMPLAALGMGTKALLDAALATTFLVAQPLKYKAYSACSVAGALAALAGASLALPEARDAVAQLRSDA